MESWGRAEGGQKKPGQAKEEVQSQKNHSKDAESEEPACWVSCTFFCVKKRTSSDRQKWKEELERYSREKYQEEEMRIKAKKELDEWEERVRRQKDQDGEHQAPRLTMSVVMQSRASFSNGKAVGVDGISAEWHGWQDWHSSYFCQ